MKSIFIILILSAAIYSNTLKNGFVYDDEAVVAKNDSIKALSNLPKLFQKQYFTVSQEVSYRPVVTLSYFIDYVLFGANPWGYHLTNIMLHTVNGVMLYIFLALFIKPHPSADLRSLAAPPFIISLLFVTHPVLTEAVNVISYREDLLAFLFYMATLTIYLFQRSKIAANGKYISGLLYSIACFLYLIALLSKEMAATLPLIVYYYESIYRDERKDSILKVLFNRYNVGFILITFVYLCVRFYYLYNPLEGHMLHWGLKARLLTAPLLLLNYLKLILFPISLSADYVIIPVKSFPNFILPFIALMFATYAAFAIMETEKKISFGFFFFIITMVPVYNIIPINNPFAERYLYLPSVGLVIVAGSLISRTIGMLSLKRRTLVFLLFAIFSLLVIYCFSVLNRNSTWKDGYSLWTDTLRKMPGSNRAHNGLGIVHAEKGEFEEAIKHYRAALKLKPNYEDASLNLKRAYSLQYGLADAVQEFQDAVRLKPNDPSAHFNLGLVYYKQENFDEAVKEYRSAVRLKPDDPKYRYNLGMAYNLLGRPEEAVMQYLAALRWQPDYPEAHNNLGITYAGLGQNHEALQEFLAALKLDSNYLDARYNLGFAYLKKGMNDKAREQFDVILKLKPDHIQSRQALRQLQVSDDQ